MSVTQTRSYDETQWVKHMQQTLDNELELEDTEIPVTIFGVPKALMMSEPESYIPQQVAIGPYHHLRAELYDMERYKVAAAKRNQKELHKVKLKTLVDHIMKFEMWIRASYHRPLSFGCEALSWMMAVDASFLFEFLQIFAVKSITRIPSRLAHLIDKSGNKTAHNAILRDIIMLENQIPLLVLRMLLELQFSSLDMADEKLLSLLTGLSKHLSPFKTAEKENSKSITVVNDCAHLLEFLYHFIVPKTDHDPSLALEIEVLIEEDEDEKEREKGEEMLAESSDVKQLRVIASNIFSNVTKKPLELMKRIILSKPLKLIVKLPWKILSNIPIIKALKNPLEKMFNAYSDKKDDDDEAAAAAVNYQKPPLQEEISIPSVTQLLEAGVRFMPTKEGISSFNFDERSLTLYIPAVKVDENTEVVLRNLVAYEACMASGPLILTRYTELMNGIVDSEVDAKQLCQRGIIINHLKSEKEVAELWNGMSKSVRLTRVASLDKVIADVNRFYSERWRVKCGNFMKEYVFGSWRILTFLAAVVMVLLMSLQAFCQVYSCHRILRIKGFDPAGME
ncbi:hypothetical protein C2S52_001192 [Perilla frutescens var. hirtella]|nr:hypothetical protein C2S52_001192 [Perilla frutescens var. hirtella]